MTWLTEHPFACSLKQLVFKESDESRFTHSHWPNDQHHGPKPVQARPFSWRANGSQDSIACLQQGKMFNGTFLFKPGYPRSRRLREQCGIKALGLLIANC